ncbi:GH92 family glycosyl hydrolase [Pedobacter faecalis]|uniref:GH92 family glycosyl hydrolase n=1 Tax=Pedobacter faecalis TaxID=3041495 RepID=UPI00254A465B|nr:GH92 family glycosyl hydrolase [Pedobacter sp. ELA7]
MKHRIVRAIIFTQLFTAGIFSNTRAQQKDFIQYVNPNIGTAHCRWFHYAPGAMPFGMAKPGPSTNGSYGNASGWEATGYDFRHTSIEGFPNFHEFQVGGVVFTATTGKLQTVPGKLESPEAGYRSAFDRKDETATAGYYAVLLKDYGIKAEVTATARVAFHRYTFPASEEAHLIFDIGNRQGESGPVKDAEVQVTEDGRIEGYVTTLPVYVQKYQTGSEVRMYFSAVVDKQPSSFGTFKGAVQRAGSRSEKGEGAGAFLSFKTKSNEPITIKAGLSYTSLENARLNLASEAKTLDFDQARKLSQQSWNNHLGRVDVSGGKPEDLQKFYTGLYHALLGRGLASDVNGAYPKNDGTVGQIPVDRNNRPLHHHYNTDAIWGAFWNLTQLWALAYPEYYSDWVKSQLLVYQDSGWLADGIANSKYVSGVGTNFVSLAMASAYMAGIRDFDVNKAYEASLKNELVGKDRPRGAGKLDVDSFVHYGYVNHIDKGNGWEESWKFSASHTMEYAFSAHAVAQWAKALGKTEDYKKLYRLSSAWEQLFDPKLKLIRPKLANGQFIDNFKPSEAWRGFQEGNSWQYTFYVPQNPNRLVEKIGRDEFNMRLDSIFTTSRKQKFGGGTTLDAFSGLEGLYNHGNQPNLHVSWLFNYSGRPSLTQKWVSTICDEFYGVNGVHGYGFGQDEDQGQLGAWYVMAAMGLLDVGGLTSVNPEMGISSPLFDKISIRLNPKYYKGKMFHILRENGGETRRYIQSMRFKGRPVSRPFISWKDITGGGELVIKMAAEPKDDYNR